MPPLPSTLTEETTQLIASLNRSQKDLQEFQIPRLRDFKGSLAVQQQYAAEAREDLETFGRSVQTLEISAEDQDRERDRREVADFAQAFSASLAQMRKDTRAAILTSKKAIDASLQSNKDELLRSSVMSEKRLDEKSGDALVNASNDVTEALRRTIGLMQGELERSVLSSQMLEQSSANLRATTTAHDTLSTLLGTSKHLITALEKSDWLDRMLILAALTFFCIVVLFILKQRIVDKSLRVAFWWTRFIPDYSGDSDLLKEAEAGALLATTTVTALSSAPTILTQSASAVTFAKPSEAVDDALSTLIISGLPLQT
ncbi:Sec20-domain-containing protein, partial [Hysterangium stoloniferum]